MRKISVKATAYGLLLLAQLIWLSGCGKPAPGPEEAIRQQIRDMAEAVQDRSSRRVSQYVADDFQLAHGSRNMERNDIERLMTAVFYRHKNISVNLTNIRVEQDPASTTRASARFNALVTGGSGGILPDTAQLYRVESDWVLVDGDWLLTSASARRALE